MARPKLTLFVDIVSPFAYMAFYMTRNSPIFKQCDVDYIPVFLGGIMQACGNTPPINIKNKDKYIAHDRDRSAKLFSIPITATPPANFPPNTLPAGRALCAVQAKHPTHLASAIEALYNVFWVEGQSIGEAEVVAKGLERVFSKDEVKGIMEGVGTAEVKKLLSDNTAAALEKGAFGLPWFVARDAEGKEESYFGFDRLGMVVEHLGLKKEGGERGFRALL